MIKMHIWIIEVEDGNEWDPTGSHYATKKEAQRILRISYPEKDWNKYRVRKYVRMPYPEPIAEIC